MPGLNDSKKLTPEKREVLFLEIKSKAVAVGVGEASAVEIDEVNIYRASQLAMDRALRALPVSPDYLLTDAMPLPSFKSLPQMPLVHGDALSASIAAASIVAKVTRDRWMRELHGKFPQYGFQNHKGYGTKEHLTALEEHGPCSEHRVTFAPVLETLARKSRSGPAGFWGERLQQAENLRELQRVGMQIKRAAADHLPAPDLARLREIYRRQEVKWAKGSA
jgi:ribonuclease HII